MNHKFKVVHPPVKPLLLYDGECKFCALWIHRWQLATGDFVDYLPFQDPRGAAQFPEIPRAHFDSAVQLILPDGSVFSAAEAVCRSLACNPQEQWLLDLYQHSPVFIRISETSYAFVARHRNFFSVLTRALWGRQLEPPQQNLVRWIFLRSLGIIYLIAFLSLWPQITQLVGSRSKIPVAVTMGAAKVSFDAQGIGVNRYHLLPTLCWFSASDGFLNLQCAAGTLLAVLVVIGFAPAPSLFLLWLIYLSLTTVAAGLPEFLWAGLLLEAGFLAVFFSPLNFLPRRPSMETPPSRLALWLLRWLVFRLTFAAGSLARLSAGAGWANPIFDAVVFSVDYVVPLAVFLPRRPRQLACLVFVLLQFVGVPASDHILFNLLAIVLCLTLLDDATLQSFFSAANRRRVNQSRPAKTGLPQRRWPTPILLTVLAVTACAGYSQFFRFIGLRMPGPEPVVAANRWLEPLRTFNSYGRGP